MERSLEAIRANCILISRESVLGGPCWYWQGHVREDDGYATFDFGRRYLNGAPIPEYIHRVAYEVANGSIDLGLIVDHLCKLRACCNPVHLEQKTQKANLAGRRKHALQTHCKRGHELRSPEDYYDYSTADHIVRKCIRCHKIRQDAYKARKKERSRG